MGQNHWITGGIQAGKTTALVTFARQWWQINSPADSQAAWVGRSVLLFAMNGDNRRHVTQRLLTETSGVLPLRSTTPLGFFEEEVMLFWPLIIEQLRTVKQTLPLRLRPEAEQYLAVQFWGQEALTALTVIERFSSERWARNLLDVIQLAAFAGVPLESVSARLQANWSEPTVPQALWSQLGQMVLEWRDWCFRQGFLTYGLVTNLYWQYLLPLSAYQAELKARYQLILADDVESYPAIARHLFEHCHRGGIEGFYTANPEFSVRLGLGADPDYLLGLRQSLDCEVTSLPDPSSGLGASLWPQLSARLNGEREEIHKSSLEYICTDTRSQLLRQTAETVVNLVKSQNVNPSDIAILGPGLDALARYALIEIIEAQGIPVMSLKEQRPLNESALVRSLLTLLTFVYDGLGRFIDHENVAEMFVVMMSDHGERTALKHDDSAVSASSLIDPVRAGLLADYCFKPDSERPQLLPLEVFPRWDRIGCQGAIAYRNLRDWIQQQRQIVHRDRRSQQHSFAETLSQAIVYFWSKDSFRYDQSAVLRELLETAQHFEEISILHDTQRFTTLQIFITVLQQGTMIANPYPVSLQGRQLPGITLATAYQYRIARLTHPYHFWLDIGSALWQQGSMICLWNALSFLQSPISSEMNAELEQEQTAMKFQIKDLSHRVEQTVFLCHSALSVSGQEQMGVLSSLAYSTNIIIAPLPGSEAISHSM